MDYAAKTEMLRIDMALLVSLAWSSVILGKVDDKLLTLQVTLPADNQQQAQTEAESIINTLTIQ